MQETLYEKLMNLKNTDEYPFHMPGHKRNSFFSPFGEMTSMDITEIEGFDDLHHADGILKEEQEFAAALLGSLQTFFLVNGSTCGVLASLCGCVGQGGRVIIARNSHKSAYHAAYLQGMEVFFVYPWSENTVAGIDGPVIAGDVARLLDKTGAKTVFITSPTYDGIVSDIAAIADEVHRRDGILIVDEAHGAHLGFHTFFPQSAVKLGADIVIQSVHKTLPSFTQTALLHVCSERAPIHEIKRYLDIFQTSSPSYPLMASISFCMHLLSEKKDEVFEKYAAQLSRFYKRTAALQHLHILNKEQVRERYDAFFDPSKVIICIENLAGRDGRRYLASDLASELRHRYHLQPEMVSACYVIAMTSIADTEEGFDRLGSALLEIDAGLRAISPAGDTPDSEERQRKQDSGLQDNVLAPVKKEADIKYTDKVNETININRENKPKEAVRINQPEEIADVNQSDKAGEITGISQEIAEKAGCRLRDAIDQETEIVLWEAAVDRTSSEFIYVYPPGSPVIVPGEVIGQAVWERINSYKEQRLNIQGFCDSEMNTIRVQLRLQEDSARQIDIANRYEK